MEVNMNILEGLNPEQEKAVHGSYGQRQKGPDACHANARQQNQLGHQQQYADDD